MTQRYNHYVTRFVTKPWEIRQGTKRIIWYYDFRQNKIRNMSSLKLFAKEHVFSPDIEIRYNQLIETPLARFRASLENDEHLENSDWEIQRALHLIFLFQARRISQARSPEKKQGFAEFLKKDDEFLNMMTMVSISTSNLVRLRIPKPQLLFYPELGIFPFVIPDVGCHTGWSYGFGLPLNPSTALITVSTTVAAQAINETPLWYYSVGLDDQAARVAIPPNTINALSHEKIIEEIRRARRISRRMIKLTARSRQLIEIITSHMDLVLEPVQGSVHKNMVAKVPSPVTKKS